MNILFSTVGRRGYLVDFFKEHLPLGSKTIGTSDRNSHETEFTSGFSHCDKYYVVPSIKDEAQYIDAILDICKKEKVDLLFSLYDNDSMTLSKHLDSFKSIGVMPVISSYEVNKICFDKMETYRFLKKHNFSTPWTIEASKVSLENIPSFPVVIKPRYGFGSIGINIAKDMSEAQFFVKYFSNEEIIIQEFIDRKEYSFDVLNDFSGNTITAVVKQKIKMRSGETDQGYSVKDDALQQCAMNLGKKLGHIGVLDVDFFLVDDEPIILELNPRFGGGYPITHFSGIDFPKILIDLFDGKIAFDSYTKYREYKDRIVIIKDTTFQKIQIQ